MLNRSEPMDNGTLEVALIPESNLCRNVEDLGKAQMAQGSSLLCFLNSSGGLTIGDISVSQSSGKTLDGTYSDVAWEEVTAHGGSGSVHRLLTVGSEGDLKLYEVKAECAASNQLLTCTSKSTAEQIVQLVQEKDLSVPEVLSVKVLSFVDARCCLLLNSSVLVQLLWKWRGAGDPQALSCCHLRLPPGDPCSWADSRLCRDTLFMLTCSGVIYVFSSVEGSQLASVDLAWCVPAMPCEGDLAWCVPAVPCEGDAPPCLSSFSLLQVSPDLTTAVAVTRSNAAVAINLNDYFRKHPDHLLGSLPQPRSALRPGESSDEDSLSSSAYSCSALGASFHTDRSWEARLTALYSRASSPTPSSPSPSSPSPSSPSPSPPQPARSSWFRVLPLSGGLQTAPSSMLSQSRVPSEGAGVQLCVPDAFVPALLSVSDFSAVLTLVSPGNSQTTVAFWDFQSQKVTYHRLSLPAAPVLCCGGEQLCLMLKASGLSLVLFCVSQEELLNRLMVFGSASTVDSLCHLNTWERCPIPLHALQAGLKNHQLDTVEFFLKSKENLLCPTGRAPEQSSPDSSQSQLKNVQDLLPALELLQVSIRDTHTESQSRQFSEQLLSITLAFLNTQVRSILSSTQEPDEGLQKCVEILDGYISALRSYMKTLPWPAGGDTCSPVTSPSPDPEEEDWSSLSTGEVVQRAVLTNQIPRAQAYLRSQSKAEQRIDELRMMGLQQAFSCLADRDLQLASTLLRNMGFNVKNKLHSICLYTDDQELRDFVVDELSKQKYLTEEEVQRVAFIKQIENLGCVPVTRASQPVDRQRVLQMAQTDPASKRLLEQRVLEASAQSEARLFTSLRLDWVTHWDPDTQRTISLSHLQDSAVSACDSVVLWRYLTSHQDQARVTCWIQNLGSQNGDPASAPQWPALPPDVVNDHTLCSAHMRDHILHMLARKGLFVQAEMADFEQLLWRLGQAGGVMQAAHPLPHYRSALGLDFHTRFIHLCLDSCLHCLLYTYLDHYRLTPRNCPALADKSLYESHPWFEMLVKIQEITRDLLEPGRVFHASLTSAQVLLPGSQASISSMLLEGHSLLALATIMFAPGGIDQVVSLGSGGSSWRVDPQLLKMALSLYPKLRAALFPPSGPSTLSSDTSIYHLMQSLHPLDPSRLFSWQSANTLSSTGETSSELPHFSSPHLVSQFALIEKLDFLYYLRHGRPSSAYGTFLVQNLTAFTDVKSHLQCAAQQAYCLAMQLFSSAPVVAACVCFCELLGACSLRTRVDRKALSLVLAHWSQNSDETTTASHRDSLAVKGSRLVEAERATAEQLLALLEAAVKDRIERKGMNRWTYEAGQEWALPVQFCQLHALPLSSVYPLDCAASGHWLHFLLFVQLHRYPPQQVRSLAGQFGPALQAHLTLSLQDLQWRADQALAGGLGGGESLPSHEAPEAPRDLLLVLLRSQEEPCPWRHLLGEAVGLRCPTLGVLAACHQDADLLQCLCVWVLTSVDEVVSAEATAQLHESPRHHEWNLHDLSIIWRALLRKRLVTPLIRGFQLFQRDSPLIHVLLMYELCCDYKNYPEAQKKLLEFQKCLINRRGGGAVGGRAAGLPLPWEESQASALLLILMQQCSTQYELRRLLRLLADMDRLLKSNGPDFKKLSLLSQVLKDTCVCLPPALLDSYSTPALQGASQGLLEQLQASALFSQARQVAQLAGLPIDSLVINELVHDLISQKAKRQWERRETRVVFWRKCHNQFRTNRTSPEAASEFFLSQAGGPEARHGSVEDVELVCVQERCLLLGLAGHWLSLLSPAPLERLEDLEKQLWISRVRQQVLQTAMETESMFSFPAPAVPPEENSYEALVKEFSFSKMAVLNQPQYLGLEGLEGPAGGGEASGQLGSEQEQSALSWLVGQLLDEGCVHEAGRVCRYFSFCPRDMWLVLRCRGLASGELQAGLTGMLPQEGSPTDRLPSVSSFSSLSSFVMVPSPEDQVLSQLQRLVDQCHHGKSYCKQVLSLYELSKELRCLYSEISSEEPLAVLQKVLLSRQPDRYQKAQAFISVQGLQPDTLAAMLASAVLQGLLASMQDGDAAEKQMFRPAEGREAFLQLAKLCGDASLLGLRLLELIPSVPLRELACMVELLILSHDCFSLTCNMEGIVRVLQAARHLSHTHLAHSDSYSLLVRLLTGIGRYNDMTYIFDLLNQNHRFEMLLRKNVESQNAGLKTALLDYLRRCLPGDSEKHNMVALCFSMRREIGENHEGAAHTQLKLIQSQEGAQPWAVTPELKSSLLKVLTLLKDAAESYSKDSCVRQAARCVRMAKLVTLQLHFLNQGQEQRVINLRPSDLLKTIIALPRCYQGFVVAEAYDYSPDMAELLYQKVVVSGDFSYLEEFSRLRPLPPSLFEDISKKMIHNKPPSSAGQNMKRLLQHCDDVYTYYKLAYEHKFFDVANMLLQDSKTSSYLNDRLGS
ncbi:spatacsin isoform X4 [Hypomesus transpacificus]|uniref:spatacsin isoform X4 n=1 Tax=Hypomesus transpacificus TaxID=137520 RepID=UPI001F074438|nr:spatacsin isoform X4 [Hypomesus transpacificus]